MESPLDCVSRALKDAVAQAREDSAKLPGPKGRLLAAQALRWARALRTAESLSPAPPAPDGDLPALLHYLETRAREDDDRGREADADRLRRCACRLARLSSTPRPKLAPDILDAQRLRALASELGYDPRRALCRVARAQSLDALRVALDEVPDRTGEMNGHRASLQPGWRFDGDAMATFHVQREPFRLDA